MTISKPFLAILASAFAIAFVAMVGFYWRSEALHDQHEAFMEEEVWKACEKADAERLKRMELEEEMGKDTMGESENSGK